MDPLPKGVRSLVYRHLFEHSYALVRDELVLIMEFIKLKLDNETLVLSSRHRIKKCTYCSTGWLVKQDIPLYLEPQCRLCEEDLRNSDAYHPPMRVLYPIRERGTRRFAS